ncbi:MAG TPA: aspartate-semialdehyde dehydrogenase [Dehalococcoidia bacterium]|nr:aspartate-semialdehyde dehydrogenase [Dehalococcoidia bacterium]
MAKSYNVAVVGATGIVGEEFLKILSKRTFPLKSLKLLASHRSAGKRIPFRGDLLEVEALTPQSFEGCDIAFISATDEVSRDYCPIAAKAGAVAIDDSGVWRMDPDVPLVVPEINPQDVENHKGILAIPNCSTTPVVLTLWPLHQRNRVRRIVASTYQSVSGTGRAAVDELQASTRRVMDGGTFPPHVYPHQIAFNLIPEIGSMRENGYTSEEMKMANESRKIMHDESIAISATCVRVPVYFAHSAAVNAEFEHPIDPTEVRQVLSCAPGVVVQDDLAAHVYPMPADAAGKDPVFVGRIRRDISTENGITFWVVGDNLRKGAALNALQIAEEMISRGVI